MAQQEYVIKNPEAPRTWKQARGLFGLHITIYGNKESAQKFANKAKTKGQASAMFKQLLKVQATHTSL